jgi:integrase
MMNLAEVWSFRPDGSNPCRHVKRFPEKKRERFLTSAELARLGDALAAAEKSLTESVATISAIRLLILTGCRLSEVLTLKWAFVDFENARLQLPESKTGEKTVYLCAPALEVLNALGPGEPDTWVLPGLRAGTHFKSLHGPWRRIRATAGLGDVRLHDLRHSFASVGAGAGLSLPIIGRMLGHTQAATTQRYAHLAADPVRQATEQVGATIAAAMSGSNAEVVELSRKRK